MFVTCALLWKSKLLYFDLLSKLPCSRAIVSRGEIGFYLDCHTIQSCGSRGKNQLARICNPCQFNVFRNNWFERLSMAQVADLRQREPAGRSKNHRFCLIVYSFQYHVPLFAVIQHLKHCYSAYFQNHLSPSFLLWNLETLLISRYLRSTIDQYILRISNAKVLNNENM